MSSTYASPLDLVERGLDELASISPEFRTLDETQELLLRISRLISRAEVHRSSDDHCSGDSAGTSVTQPSHGGAHGKVATHVLGS